MAKHKKRKNRDAEENEEQHNMPPGTKRGIIIVLLFLVIFLSAASLIERAGPFGTFIKRLLEFSFGFGSWFVILVLAVLAIMLLRSRAWRLRSINYLGVLLFVASWLGLAHTLIDEAPLAAARAGHGGGIVGFIMRTGFERLLGFWPTVVILFAMATIAILLFFEMSLEDLAVHRILFRSRRKDDFDEEGHEEDEKDEESEGAEKALLEIQEDKSKTFFGRGLLKSRTASEQPTDVQTASVRKSGAVRRKCQFSIDLLEPDHETPTSGDIEVNMERIEKTLAQFGIDVSMGEVSVGPTVTQYTLKPAEGVKISKITALSADLALALAAHPIRIEAPIPGKSLVGIEVPNQHIARVMLRPILESREFRKAESPTTIVLGRDVAGKPWLADIADMPHLLVAGATGSGKSVCLHTIITALLYQNPKEQLKLILIDPKRVELSVYNGVPHLMTPVIIDVKKTVNALKWAILEMERRFDLLSATNKRDIIQYNKETDDLMPYLVIIIDELADLMAATAGEVEGSVIRIAQMARAVGIHLIVATQRPSVNVITGLIKANITSRIAFAVASQTDSRTIIDQAGAEKLLGRGDMLFTSAELSKPRRLQGSFVSQGEIKKAVKWITEQNGEVDYDESITERSGGFGVVSGDFEDEDKMFSEARELVVRERKASSSYLQRRLKVGYARAARLMDLLEEAGVVGPQDGAKPREILVRANEYFEGGKQSEDESFDREEYKEE